jgi:hypothetical protein
MKSLTAYVLQMIKQLWESQNVIYTQGDKFILASNRGGQLDQLREPHFWGQQTARAMYSPLKIIKTK